MTPTRFPVRSTLCFQSCAWKESPLKTSTPWMLGIVGEDRAPFVKKRKRALVQSLLSVRTAQSRWVSSYVALVTAVQKQRSAGGQTSLPQTLRTEESPAAGRNVS
eukprot:CAMPEP_0175593694 /NCGR_PEP_ID=MMETSP0096-20121207/54067_1 /TAXON_ID=311494 /ORGANISM="Alexandrium monilatum, Strain CCMP3105" /LENGTH=104 /DNA_ID=CAMNT_0016897971 /DNA_START=135 /DNA_END=446 /DNA_ORIENTATION=+